ncbi:hypothetical protein [Magnetospirillum sp. UT-4]|uniref:hypothetical protein n=1 Tax=Magnetospirillum sp. UT-4 TaxID=2681467 RepID=UPI00137EC443|nr:hypothetical protein [Magnetospirillum sp. UT-4]CAA7615134.1 conserved hypothetical protein [Magnetospirillum sp. UT-4]
MTRTRIHGLEDARRALAAAAGAPVILDSPPGAAGLHGIGWWQALLRRLDEEFPGAPFEAVLDCGAAPGLALAALAAGIGAVRVATGPEALARLRAVAAETGARVEDASAPGPTARGGS